MTIERNDRNKLIQIFSTIQKRVVEKNYPCLCNGCSLRAINSHLLQENGILSYVSEGGHMYEPKIGNMYGEDFLKAPGEFKLVGSDKALSVKTFCKYHDDTLFSGLEKHHAELTTYKSFLLLTYRTICAEIRRKEHAIEIAKRYTSSAVVNSILPEDNIAYYKQNQIEAQTLGINDMLYYARDIENKLESSKTDYIFIHKSFLISGLYASSTFSIVDFWKDKKDEPLGLYIIHIIPTQSNTIVILGYEKNKVKQWAKEYIEELLTKDESTIEEYLTSFLIRIEGWGMSPNVYKRLKRNKIQDYFQKFNIDRKDLVSQRFDGFNLFDGALLKEYKDNHIEQYAHE